MRFGEDEESADPEAAGSTYTQSNGWFLADTFDLAAVSQSPAVGDVRDLARSNVPDSIANIIVSLLGWAGSTLQRPLLSAFVLSSMLVARRLIPVLIQAVGLVVLPPAQALGEKVAGWVRGSPPHQPPDQPGPSG